MNKPDTGLLLSAASQRRKYWNEAMVMQAHHTPIKRSEPRSIRGSLARFMQVLRTPPALLPVALGLPAGAQAQSMRMMGGMMWPMVIFWLLIAVLVVLAIAALIKYLFGGK